MKDKMKKISSLFSVLLVGCASIVPMKPIPENANLIITRSNQFAGGGCDLRVFVDNETSYTTLERGQSTFYSLTPGSHILRAKVWCLVGGESLLDGNVQGYPIEISKGILHLSVAQEGTAKAMIPIVGMFLRPETNFRKAEE